MKFACIALLAATAFTCGLPVKAADRTAADDRTEEDAASACKVIRGFVGIVADHLGGVKDHSSDNVRVKTFIETHASFCLFNLSSVLSETFAGGV